MTESNSEPTLTINISETISGLRSQVSGLRSQDSGHSPSSGVVNVAVDTHICSLQRHTVYMTWHMILKFKAHKVGGV